MGGITPKLSKSAIENIFQLRANGKSYGSIAKRYPCSDHFIRQVINRTVYSDVEIDAGLVHGAQNVGRAKPKHKAKSQTSPEDKFQPLARLMAAQRELVEAYADCRKAGLGKAFLDLAMEEVGSICDEG